MGFQRKKPPAIGVKAPYPRLPSSQRWRRRSSGCRKARPGSTRSSSTSTASSSASPTRAPLFTRNGINRTRRFKKIADDAFLINAASAILDGEVVVPAADGTTDFSVLQNELKGKSTPIAGFALKANKFDGIYLGRRRGKDLVYAGKVDHGFDQSSTAELQTRQNR
jgi:bifunctional non-homologous end joining protein LigD